MNVSCTAKLNIIQDLIHTLMATLFQKGFSEMTKSLQSFDLVVKLFRPQSSQAFTGCNRLNLPPYEIQRWLPRSKCWVQYIIRGRLSFAYKGIIHYRAVFKCCGWLAVSSCDYNSAILASLVDMAQLLVNYSVLIGYTTILSFILSLFFLKSNCY